MGWNAYTRVKCLRYVSCDAWLVTNKAGLLRLLQLKRMNEVDKQRAKPGIRTHRRLLEIARRYRATALISGYERMNHRRIADLARQVNEQAPQPKGHPVAFVKLSSGILNLNLNNAFHLLTSLALQLQDQPVVHFACQAGMSRCVPVSYTHLTLPTIYSV